MSEVRELKAFERSELFEVRELRELEAFEVSELSEPVHDPLS